MAHGYVIRAGAQHLPKGSSRGEHGARCSDPYLPEGVHARPRQAELAREPTLEAEREVRLHPRDLGRVARQGQQQRLDAAVQVAAVHVKDAQRV